MNEQIALTITLGIISAGYFSTGIAYMKLAPWYLTPIGRWFVTERIILGAIFALITINRALNGDITRTVWVFAGLTLGVVAWGTFVTVVHTQRHVNKQEAEDTEDG